MRERIALRRLRGCGHVPQLLLDSEDLPEAAGSPAIAWMCMELLGPDVYATTDRYMVTETEIVVLSLSMLEVLAAVHQRGFVHKSVKPENFCIDLRKSSPFLLRLIDFGRSQAWIAAEDAMGERHDVDIEALDEPFTGWWYSMDAFLGLPQSPVDDVFSVVHILGYLLDDVTSSRKGSGDGGEPYSEWRHRFVAAIEELLDESDGDTLYRMRHGVPLEASPYQRRLRLRDDVPSDDFFPRSLPSWWRHLFAECDASLRKLTPESKQCWSTIHGFTSSVRTTLRNVLNDLLKAENTSQESQIESLRALGHRMLRPSKRPRAETTSRSEDSS
jgi:serine/threonine protein kinase